MTWLLFRKGEPVFQVEHPDGRRLRDARTLRDLSVAYVWVSISGTVSVVLDTYHIPGPPKYRKE